MSMSIYKEQPNKTEGELERELRLMEEKNESIEFENEEDFVNEWNRVSELPEDDNFDYYEDLDFIEQKLNMLSFKKFQDEEKQINEKIGYGGIVKTTSILMLMRLKRLQSNIKREEDIKKKLDLVGVQNLYLGSLMTLGLSVDIKDKSLIGRSRKFSNIK
tara:strand:- start:57 stop:536 length:480 start_codon:yes stop_codon:yes gene_type:complete